MSNETSKTSIIEFIGIIMAILGFFMLICGNGVGFLLIILGGIIFLSSIFK